MCAHQLVELGILHFALWAPGGETFNDEDLVASVIGFENGAVN